MNDSAVRNHQILKSFVTRCILE